jgi:glycosyltransferase involved in cell wall biosynthesis
MHFTYFSLPIFYSRKFITTIHDLTPLFYKTGLASTHHPLIYEIKYFFYKLVIKRQIKNALKIITPTAAVKQELMSLFDQVLNKKIVVTHEGVDYRLKQTVSNQSLRLRIGEHKYFLYVGNFYPHKNVAMLIRSFSDLPGQKLVLAGPTNYFSQKIEQLIQTLNLQKKIFLLKTRLLPI